MADETRKMKQDPNAPGAPDPPTAETFKPARSDRGAAEGASQDLGALHPTALKGENLRFRCADAGQANCDWQVSGRSEEEIMPQIELHAQERHGMHQMDDQTRSKVRGAIQRRAA